MSYASPYAGLRVIDLSQGVAGPYCTMLLAQYGADVVKVEPPEGDWARHLGKPSGDHTAFSISANLGKRSVVLDLKDEAARSELWTLLGDADVFVEGFRPGVIERLGFGYEAVAAANPRILYLSISGFGYAGPLGDKPAMDPVLQAFTGFMAANRDKEGTPQRVGPIIIDMSTALYCFQALSAALFARRGADRGRKIEASLMQGAANLQVVRMLQTYLLGEQPLAATAPSGAFPCGEGYLFIVVFRQDDFVKLCGALGLETMASDPRFQTPGQRFEHQAELNARVGEVFRTRSAAEWSGVLGELGIQNQCVLDYLEFLAHPQVEATELVSWLEQPGLDRPVPLPNPPGTPRLTPGDRRARSPRLGEHTEEVLGPRAAIPRETG